MDAPHSATPNGQSALAGNDSAIPRGFHGPEPDTQQLRGGRAAAARLASRLRDLAAIILLAFAAISPLRAEPCQLPVDSAQRAHLADTERLPSNHVQSENA
jgi:hypothetical protein